MFHNLFWCLFFLSFVWTTFQFPLSQRNTFYWREKKEKLQFCCLTVFLFFFLLFRLKINWIPTHTRKNCISKGWQFNGGDELDFLLGKLKKGKNSKWSKIIWLTWENGNWVIYDLIYWQQLRRPTEGQPFFISQIDSQSQASNNRNTMKNCLSASKKI